MVRGTLFAVTKCYTALFFSKGLDWLLATFDVSSDYDLSKSQKIKVLSDNRIPPMPALFFNPLVDNFLALSDEDIALFASAEPPSVTDCFPLDLNCFPWLAGKFASLSDVPEDDNAPLCASPAVSPAPLPPPVLRTHTFPSGSFLPASAEVAPPLKVPVADILTNTAAEDKSLSTTDAPLRDILSRLTSPASGQSCGSSSCSASTPPPRPSPPPPAFLAPPAHRVPSPPSFGPAGLLSELIASCSYSHRQKNKSPEEDAKEAIRNYDFFDLRRLCEPNLRRFALAPLRTGKGTTLGDLRTFFLREF